MNSSKSDTNELIKCWNEILIPIVLFLKYFLISVEYIRGILKISENRRIAAQD